jgi:hypothetical protein
MDLLLDKFASNVATQMVKNAAIFTNPPFPIANLDAAQKAFHQADADASNLGKQLTAEKNTKREIVIDLLRQLAAYRRGHLWHHARTGHDPGGAGHPESFQCRQW